MASQLEMYKANQHELVKKYDGKIIAVKDGEFQGVYPSKLAALRAMELKYPPKSFIIIKCTPGPEEYSVIFRSRITKPDATGPAA